MPRPKPKPRFKVGRSEDKGNGKGQATSSAHELPDDGIVRLLRQTKGRKGGGVTLVQGLKVTADELKALAKWLKSQCGVGGAIKSGVIELQTSDRERVKALLEEKAFRVKIAGG